jgi:pimeloyl-ACP methyl ester carboxylesterase
MTIVAVDAAECGAADRPGHLPGALADAVVPGAPVTVMTHGFRYRPGDPRRCPHRSLLSPDPRRAVAWPRRLGFGRGAPGIAVGFGWAAAGSLWRAYAASAEAGGALARLVAGLRAAGAGRINIIGHSLGARVALHALPALAAGDVARLILLSGAEFRAPARDLLSSPAGRAAEVLNVASGENALFDVSFALLVGRGEGPMLSAGLDLPQAVTLRIDCDRHRAAVAALGFPVAPADRLVCHWSAYTRPGLFPLYRAFLHRPDRLPFGLLRAALPAGPGPRRPRLMPPAALPPGSVAAH